MLHHGPMSSSSFSLFLHDHHLCPDTMPFMPFGLPSHRVSHRPSDWLRMFTLENKQGEILHYIPDLGCWWELLVALNYGELETRMAKASSSLYESFFSATRLRFLGIFGGIGRRAPIPPLEVLTRKRCRKEVRRASSGTWMCLNIAANRFSCGWGSFDVSLSSAELDLFCVSDGFVFGCTKSCHCRVLK